MFRNQQTCFSSSKIVQVFSFILAGIFSKSKFSNQANCDGKHPDGYFERMFCSSDFFFPNEHKIKVVLQVQKTFLIGRDGNFTKIPSNAGR